jgi:uncharacterized protein (DUF1697 family)
LIERNATATWSSRKLGTGQVSAAIISPGVVVWQACRMPRYIALLRGINLGGKRRVGMSDLRGTLEDAGYEDVRTHLASGNVVLTSGAKPNALERKLEELLRREFGFDIAVVARTRDELAAVIQADPFGTEADDPARYQVSFLSKKPKREAVERLEEAAVSPERVAVLEREVYAWHPGGVGRSDLAKLITAERLGVGVTARNWRTITKLLELAGSPPKS